ncbi:MAG TPA: hypothetical protein VJ990_06320, partial [Clostridia bacterium]|nr:hypothetical protein [Clostridia bacterium]
NKEKEKSKKILMPDISCQEKTNSRQLAASRKNSRKWKAVSRKKKYKQKQKKEKNIFSHLGFKSFGF